MMIIYGTGNLTRDPEQVTTNNGKTICKMCIAVNELYTNEDGSRKTQFFNLVVWNKLAESCLKFLKKGSKIGIVGNPQTRTYESGDGVKKSVFEIVCNEVEFL